MLESFQGLETLDLSDLVFIKPEFLEHNAFFETGGASDPVITQVKLFDVPQFIEALNGIEIVLGQPAFFEVFAPINSLKKD